MFSVSIHHVQYMLSYAGYARTGNNWMNEVQTFRDTAGDMREHAEKLGSSRPAYLHECSSFFARPYAG